MFTRYKNLSGRSNVIGYRFGLDSIDVIFNGTNRIYTYSIHKAGRKHVDNMKVLATRGEGLNSYINKYCKHLYD